MQKNRRRFLQVAASIGSVAAASWLPASRAAHLADALLLSCMDFRLMDDIERYMVARGLRDKYDHVVLAGSSLGAVTSKYPAWNQTFWEHLDVAAKLHGISRVIVMDHRDCGAYKLILGPEHVRSAAVEKDTHAAQLSQLKQMIHERYPRLQVETLLMALDGTAQPLD